MATSEIEMGIIRGKRQTMLEVSRWIGKKVELTRKTAGTVDKGLILDLLLGSLDNLKGSIDRQVGNGVRTLDCGDFLPE